MKRYGLPIIILLTLVPTGIQQAVWITHFWEGSVSDYRGWFPQLYLPAYVLVQAYYPVLLGYWVWRLARLRSLPVWLSASGAIAQSALSLYLQHHPNAGLLLISYNIAALLLLTTIIATAAPRQRLWQWLGLRAPWVTYWPAWFFFAGYIILSLVLPEMQPFSRYPMYSSFPDYAQTFLVRDGRGQLVPLQRYFTVGGADLSHIYSRLHALYSAPAAGLHNEAAVDSATGRELYRLLMAGCHTRPATDSISIDRQTIRMIHDTIQTHETILYTGAVE